MTSSGFSLTEALVALVLTMTVTSAALTLVMPATRASMTQPEAMDVQQRARVAAEMIGRDLSAAGGARPAVLPRRLGVVRGDGPDVARDSAITLLSVPIAAPATTTAASISAAALLLSVNPSPSCLSALCGFSVGQDVLIADVDHQFDVFRITGITGATATLRHHGQDLAWTYPAGAAVSLVVSRTFEYDAAAHQLRQYDGDQSDQPAVDHLERVTFSYCGVTAAGAASLEVIPLASLRDGPWLGAGTTRFDADLLRVRSVRVTVGAEAATASLRERVPTLSLTLDVTPRGLGVG